MKNPLLTIKKTDRFISEIKKLGYIESPKNGGSHRIFRCEGKPTLSIPDNREIAPGTRRNLVKLVLGNEYYS